MINSIPWKKVAFGVFSALMIGNLVVLDISLFENNKIELQGKKENEVNSGLPALKTPDDICPNSCISKINEATSSIKLSVEPTSIPVKKTSSTDTTLSSVKEFIIPFGSGTNATDDWTDVTGLRTYIDSQSYGKIKTSVFEATMHIPDGNQIAYVRLFNVTDKHPVWFSEVSIEGGGSQMAVSQSITLDKGNKLYQVQMKTSLKHDAVLDQARVRITTY